MVNKNIEEWIKKYILKIRDDGHREYFGLTNILPIKAILF